MQWFYTVQQSLIAHWEAWAVFAGYLAATWVIASVARWLAQRVITWLTARTNTSLDDRLSAAAARPTRWLILAGGLRLALGALGDRIPSLRTGQYADTFHIVETASVGLVILAASALVNALLHALLDWSLEAFTNRANGASWDRKVLPMLKRLCSIVVYFIAISIILDRFNYPITALITTAGVASLAVALAAQETLSNVLGGIVILADRMFRTGDWIELPDGKMGEVIDIGLRSTHIRLFDGTVLVVPNKDMANSRIVNLALPTPRAAIRQTIRVAYGTDLEKAKQLLLDVMRSHPEVLDDPAPGVWFTTFNQFSLDLFMSCWVESYRDRFRVTDELNMQILKTFREHGIEIPIPQQAVHIRVRDDRSAVPVHAPEGPA